jgi:hypothetical protein
MTHSTHGGAGLAWNGSTWTIQPTPNASGTDTYLTGVSRPSPGVCTASGYSGGQSNTLIEGARTASRHRLSLGA